MEGTSRRLQSHISRFLLQQLHYLPFHSDMSAKRQIRENKIILSAITGGRRLQFVELLEAIYIS